MKPEGLGFSVGDLRTLQLVNQCPGPQGPWSSPPPRTPMTHLLMVGLGLLAAATSCALH